MDNHAAGVDENPVGCRKSLDTGIAEAAVFQTFAEFLCHGGNLPGRTTGGDHHEVRNAGFAFQVDGHKILRLIIVK